MLNKHTPADLDLILKSDLSNLAYLVDDFFNLKFSNKRGRPAKLNFTQLLDCLDKKRRYACDTWLGLYQCLVENTKLDLPTYGNFLSSVKRLTVFLGNLIFYETYINRERLLTSEIKIALIDSTPLPTCKIQRSSRHKTMFEYANFSKSTMGWFYGIKLHLITDITGTIVVDFKLTKSNFDDRQYLKEVLQDKDKFLNSQTLFVADKGYQAKWLDELAKETGNYLITGKRKSKLQKPLASKFDIYLLHIRARIESVFSNLKLNCFLTSTRSRSVLGYLFTYVTSLYYLILKKK